MKLIRLRHPIIYFFVLLGVALILILNIKPAAITISLFLFLVTLISHFFFRIFIPWHSQFLSHFWLVYLPLIVSYFLFLSWQQILEPLLLLPILLIIIIFELCLRTLGV